jgi:TetR/AcrR family transcriptional regulator
VSYRHYWYEIGFLATLTRERVGAGQIPQREIYRPVGIDPSMVYHLGMATERTEARRPGRPRNPISRDELLATARQAFAESGYAGTSMGTIAERAGLRKASLFHHFATKQALYFEVLAGIATQLEDLIGEANLGEGPYLARLDRMGDRLGQTLGAHPHTARIIMREFIEGGPYLADSGRATTVALLQATSGFLEQGMDEGVLTRRDPRHLALSVIGLHLTYFAAADFSSALLGSSVFDPPAVDDRVREVQAQVRALCGARD